MVAVGFTVTEVPTVTGVWRTADWHAREDFDLFGINFIGHPRLNPWIAQKSHKTFSRNQTFWPTLRGGGNG